MSHPIASVALLSAEDERTLARRIEAGLFAAEALANGDCCQASAAELSLIERQGRRAWEQFLLANVRLVQQVARREAIRTRQPMDELFQEGFVGLVMALQRWDHRRGTRFSTFALFWIRYYITDAATTECGRLQMSGKTARRLRQVRAVEVRLGQELGRSVREGDLISAMGGRVSALDLVALEGRVGLDGLDLAAPEADDELGEGELRRWVRTLAPAERDVIEARYGLATGAPMTQTEVARRLRVGLNTVRRREQQALESLRARARHAGVA